MSDLETMAANVQGQHDALMHAQGLPTYESLRQQNAELVRVCENALNAMCIGAKADETMLQACDSIRAILAKVQS